MPNIDLSILNQRQTPAFYADTLANRPAAGFVGRIFVSTNTFAFYRDNGTGWDLIGGPGTGTVTGTGANGQVTFWNGASTITGSNDLFWDSANGHFGVNTNVPGTALDVHHDQPTVAILNQTVATNDVRIGFQNNGVGLWRIGAFYNAGANDFGIYDAVAAIQPVTVKKTTGQVLIGTSTVGSGKLVVASSTGDNGIQIVGASAPSLRIDNAESGPTKRAGLGISTATNNFIQGSADRDFCIFNGSTAAASPILFGVYDAAAVNVQEAARISPARNFLIGTTTDGGQKLQISGGARATGYFLDGMTAGAGALYYSSTENRVTLANYNASGILVYEVSGGAEAMRLNALSQLLVNRTTNFNAGTYQNQSLQVTNGIGINSDSADRVSRLSLLGNSSTGDGIIDWGGNGNFNLILSNNGNTRFLINGSGNVGIGINAPSAKLDLLVNDSATDVFTLNASNGVNASLEVYLKSNVTTLNAGGAGTFVFANGNNTERMRLATGTGNLLIGTTTDAGYKLNVSGKILATTNGNAETHLLIGDKTDGGSSPVECANSNTTTTSDASPALNINKYSATTSSSARFIQFYAGNFTTAMGGIVGNGASNVQFATLSDIREKENILSINNSLEKLLLLNPVQFDWKKTKEHVKAGFIAQEVEKIFPEFVIENFANEGEEERKAITGGLTSGIVAHIIKAIQELNTKIENIK